MFRDFFRRLGRGAIKGLLLVFGLSLVSFGLPALLGLGIGIGGIVMAGRYFKRSDELRASGEKVTLNKVLGREGLLRANGWNLNGVPLDMLLRTVDGRHAVVSAAGIDGLIKAEKPLFRKNADYTFNVDNLEAAQRVKSFIDRVGPDAAVARNTEGGYTVTCHDLVVANALAKEAFPQRKAKVERRVVQGRQYLVEDATSYEDAVALLKENPGAYHAFNSYGSVSYKLDGKEGETMENGSPIGSENFPNGLHVGAYIVNVEDVTVTKGDVKVPYGLEGCRLDEFLNDSVSENGEGFSSTKSSVYADGTPEDVSRYFIAEQNGKHVELRNPGMPMVVQDDGLKAYVLAGSMDELKAMLNDGAIPEGTYVSISDSAPTVGAGKYLLELDLADVRVRSCLPAMKGLPASVQARLSELGVDDAAVNYSRILDRVKEKGSYGTYLDKAVADDLFLSDVKVMGVPAAQLSDRLVSERCPELDEKKAAQWAREAAQIQKIDVEIDPVHAQIRITSTIAEGNNLKTKFEVFPIDEKDLGSVRKGAVSTAEMKDLLMQLHPDYFQMYANESGNSVFKDSIGAFVRGEKPELVKKPRVRKTPAQTPVQAQNNQKKPGLKPGFNS